MVIARLIKEKLSSTPAGVVLTTRDFGVEMRYQPALAKALNRLVLQGELQKIAKGKYYIPKKTIFGNLKPADSELVKDFLEQNGKIVGYITGTAAFASMGLTTQISWVTCKSVWLCINSCEPKKKELSVNNTSQLCSKLLNFSIKRFCCSIS